MTFMMTMRLDDSVLWHLWVFMEHLNGAFGWPVFLRFEYNGCYIYLGDYEVPVLSIKCQFFSLTVKGLCYGGVL